METVKLNTKRPMMSRGQVVWYEAGHEFEVLERKELPALKGLWLKLKDAKYHLPIDGYNNPEDFQ